MMGLSRAASQEASKEVNPEPKGGHREQVAPAKVDPRKEKVLFIPTPPCSGTHREDACAREGPGRAPRCADQAPGAFSPAGTRTGKQRDDRDRRQG